METQKTTLFIKNSIKEYSLDEIRKYLFEKEVTQKEFDDAISHLVLNPVKSRVNIFLIGFFSVAIAVCIPMLVSEVKNLPAYFSGRAVESEKTTVFRGISGFKLFLPGDYKFSRTKNKDGLETATFYPDSMSFKSLTGRKKGVYRLNVIPRQTKLAGKKLDLETMQANHLALAKKQNLDFELSKMKNLPFSAFVLKSHGDNKYTEVVIEGTENIYIFTAAYDNDEFYSIIKSITEY